MPLSREELTAVIIYNLTTTQGS